MAALLVVVEHLQEADRDSVGIDAFGGASPAQECSPPSSQDRSGESKVYEAARITDLPEHGHLWFADGGLVQSDPVGRVLEARQDLVERGGGRQLMLLVHPRSEGPSTGNRWSDPTSEPEAALV